MARSLEDTRLLHWNLQMLHEECWSYTLGYQQESKYRMDSLMEKSFKVVMKSGIRIPGA